MEVLLNAIWLAVAIVFSLVWRVRWLPELRACSAKSRKWQSLVGLVCVLALLFPAISLTDDLHPSVMALTDTKSVYCVAHTHDSAGPVPRSNSPVQGFAGAIRVSRFHLILLPHDSPVSFAQIFTRNGSHCGRISGRAPPFSPKA
jgi:hypothetical protein